MRDQHVSGGCEERKSGIVAQSAIAASEKPAILLSV